MTSWCKWPIDQACSFKMAEYWLSFYALLGAKRKAKKKTQKRTRTDSAIEF